MILEFLKSTALTIFQAFHDFLEINKLILTLYITMGSTFFPKSVWWFHHAGKRGHSEFPDVA